MAEWILFAVITSHFALKLESSLHIKKNQLSMFILRTIIAVCRCLFKCSEKKHKYKHQKKPQPHNFYHLMNFIDTQDVGGVGRTLGDAGRIRQFLARQDEGSPRTYHRNHHNQFNQ